MAPLSRTCLLALAIASAGCTSYVKQEDFNSTVTELRSTDQKLQSEIDALSQKYDALATQVAGMIRVDTVAHFATNDATLSDQDKPLLDGFAKAMKNHPDAVVTVEGFADPAGSTRYNRQLGKRRAEGVRDYLVTTGGLPAGQVRTVSYGEDANRQVVPGGVKDAGLPNRRVSLVIDSAGSQASTMPATPAPPATAPEQPSPPQPEQPTTPPGQSSQG
jgi:peptidoglycan-associated lipoprotein